MRVDLSLTIFGGTGDLTFRKLLPALYNMSVSGRLPRHSRIVAIGRRGYDDEAYREAARGWVEKFSRLPYEEEAFGRFAERISYYRMDLSDLEEYKGLDAFYAGQEVGAHIFYFAVAPRFFDVITRGLASVAGAGGGKVIIEKPFGEDLRAASSLNEELESFFSPEHIYRIDHYLGKEMVRNIQAIRFTNPIFRDVWNAEHIECIQISALEDVGVETRGGYYDASGALKDMVQNHLFQILSIVAMERPEGFYGPGMHEEQLKVLHSLRPVDSASIEDTLVLGQYEGYRQEPLVGADSTTETYAALRLFVDNERWRGMPFYIRTGKRMGERQMEVSIVFKRPSPVVEPDILVIKIQPVEGVHLQFNIKRPGEQDDLIPAKMDFCQNCSLIHRLNTPEAYERLLAACIEGKRAWFSQWDQIDMSWRYIGHIRRLYREAGLPPYPYAPGTHGPKEAEGLPQRFGHQWVEDGEMQGPSMA